MSISTSSDPTSQAPAEIARLPEVMAGYPARWSLCGGWAIDAWLGRISRDHGDVDLSVYDADHEQLADHLAEWQLIAHSSAADDASTGQWDGHRLAVPSHIHARAPEDAGPLPADGICEPAKGWWLDIQIDGATGEEWVLSQEPRIARAVSDSVRMSPWGVPATVPAVLLFFKAPKPRRRDHEDFLRTLRHLDKAESTWLGESIAALNPDHAWLTQL